MSFPGVPCSFFGAGITFSEEGEPTICVTMAETEEGPVNVVMMDLPDFNDFITRCMSLAVEATTINVELEGLEGSARDARLKSIQERYAAGAN
jgi:hypothetical protein